ncbi:zinc finger protein 654-like [Lampris incognitus]|uniref:zinc finger protein 654-like n=1 Tax=Lampris incognitus TaxID=2546036 RepID=UPI0024B60E7B|nr:zinc finger protein 654-like [Lampris incognitus]
MAEEDGTLELEGFEKQLRSLFGRHSSHELQIESKPFCSEFCKLVEEYTCLWQTPLPQLRVLEMALCYFVRASTFLPTNCDHVHYTLNRLAL